jgi:hypothetical protein
MPKKTKATALKQLREACLRLDVILCLNEVQDEAIEHSLGVCLRKLRSALKTLDPKTRLPDVLLDTRLGKSIQEAKKAKKCDHVWRKADPPAGFSNRGKWERCVKCKCLMFRLA